MSASVNAQALVSKLQQGDVTSSQLENHHQDVSIPATMASDSGPMVASSESSLKEEESISSVQIEDLKAQIDTLKRNLQDVESKLNEDSALRLTAECALNECREREKSLLKFEQDSKTLQEEVKWRNEQFESLQEAHNRMRDQFHEDQNMWAAEKAAMLRNIEVLTEKATELDGLQAVVNDVRECNTKAERRILLLEDRLRDAQKELEAKNNLSHSFLTVQEHDEVVLAMRSEYEALQRQLSASEAERYELEKERDKLLTESREKKQPRKREKEELPSNGDAEGRKERSSLPAGQRMNTRQQLEDFAKQVKSLNTELQKWKDIATESYEGSSKLQSTLERAQKENEELRAQLNGWMQKESQYIDSTKDLEADVQKWKHSATSHADENRLCIQELENLRAEVEKWKNVAATAEREGKSARRKPLDSLGMFEDEMEVINRSPNVECDSEMSLREQAECSRQGSGRTTNEWKHVASELETALQAEVEDWKKRVICAEKEQEDMRQHFDLAVKELHLEVATWKKSAACAAEDGRLERIELENKLKEFHVKSKDTADRFAEERQRSALEVAALQAELQSWKVRAADAAEECTSLRDAHEKVIIELLLCKQNAETASEKGKSVIANLEKEVRDLEIQVDLWEQKAEEALEGVAKIQEYEDLIKAFERTLLEKEEQAAAAASDSQALQDELNSAIAVKSAENHQLCSVITELKSELSELNGKVDDNHSSQLLHLQSLLTKTQSQLQEWQHKATVAFQVEDELRHAVEEIRSQTDELQNFIKALKEELLEWKEKAEHLEALQLQLTSSLASSQEELLLWKQKAVDATTASEQEVRNTVCVLEAEVRNSVHVLEAELCQWKEKAQEGELLHQQMRTSVTEMQRELQEMKENMAAFTSSTDSLKDELSGANELASALTTQLSTQKQNILSLQKLNRQLEADLVLVREEALCRKEWMTQILTQLEGTVSMSQKELQSKLHVASHRLLGNESVNSRVGEDAAAKAFPVGSDGTHNIVNCISSPETAAPFTSHCQSDENGSLESKPDIFRGSVMNLDVDKLRQELSSSNSFVSKLEHARGSDGENSFARSVAGCEEKMRVVLSQKQVESSRVTKEFQRNRIDSLNRPQGQSGVRPKVLAEVDGNSLHVPANHDKVQPDAPGLHVAPDNIPFSRLRCDARGV